MGQMIDAIRDGMAKHTKDAALVTLGNLLTAWALRHPAEAEEDAGNKTLEGAMGAVRNYAQKHKSGSCACIDDKTVLKLAVEYFGGKATEADTEQATHDAEDDDDLSDEPEPAPAEPSLDELLKLDLL